MKKILLLPLSCLLLAAPLSAQNRTADPDPQFKVFVTFFVRRFHSFARVGIRE